METNEIVKYLKPMYREIKVLPDGTIAAICDLFTTRSIMIDCDECTYKRRFCFKDRSLADEWFAKIKSANEVPTGYVARRPEQEDRADPYLNKLHQRPWNKKFEQAV